MRASPSFKERKKGCGGRQEQLTTEKAQWQSDVGEKITNEYAAKEEALRVRLTKERDVQPTAANHDRRAH